MIPVPGSKTSPEEAAAAGELPVTADAASHADEFGATSVEIELHGTRRRMDVAQAGELVIGRSSEATLAVDDERVSRRHLRIAVRDGVLVATDLGSRNGTLLNGRRMTGERRIHGCDVLEVGPLRIRAGGAAREAALLAEGDLINRLDQEVARARTFQRPLSVVGLALKGPQHEIDDAIARVSGRLGRPDSAGECGLGRFLVILPERRLEAASVLAASWKALAEGSAGVYATVCAAAVPDSGEEAGDLLAAVFSTGRHGQADPARRGPIAEDPRSREVFKTARRVARSTASVLITGESGAGKEWVAHEIHTSGPRGAGPFVRVNCAALPELLIESELFGHERGAFTSADRRRIGRIEAAHGGTLFLDEIAELALPLQAKLLHVLEDRYVMRVGSNERVPVDVRFVFATNQDLESEVRAGRFRKDLYYRLSAITIQVPPLRERPADLRALAEHFLVEAARAAGRTPPRMDDSFRVGLETYSWPGNVRELKNVIERAIALSDRDVLSRSELPERLRSGDTAKMAGPMRERMDGLELRSLEEALAECGGNRTHAARKLGISRRTLIYKLHKFGLLKKDD